MYLNKQTGVNNNNLTEEKKYCQKQAILFNSFNQIITNTLTGDIMVLFLTDILLFQTINITFILSLVPLISIIRLPLIFALRSTDKIKLIKIGIKIKMLFITALFLIPWTYLDYVNYMALLIVYQIAVEFGVGLCWQPLMREITTNEDRGKFFSTMRFVFMMLNSIYVFLLSLFTNDVMKASQYRVLLMISFFGLLLQYYAIGKMGKRKIIFEYENIKSSKKPIIEQIKDNKMMILPLILDLIFLIIGFTLNVVYLKTALHYSSQFVSLYITVFNLSGTVLLPVIGKKFDKNLRKGSQFVCVLYLAYLCILLMLPVHTREGINEILLVLLFAFLSGVISASVYLMMTILQHGMVRSGEDSFIILNLYQIIIYFAAFLATNFMGFIISISTEVITFGVGISMDTYKIINTVLILIGIAMVRTIMNKIKNKYEWI